MCHQDLLSPLEMEAEREESLRHRVYYRTGDETEGLDLEQRRESGDLNPPALLACLICGLLASLEGLAGWDPGNACWSLGLGERLERTCVLCWRWGSWGQGGGRNCSR